MNFGGYVRATPGTPAKAGERRYYVFPYDWRQDNVEQAKRLEELIDAIRKDYGDPELRVDIVAHSMGGLIARYYLRFGPIDVLDGMPSLISLYGTKRVRKLILLGTPNFGTVSALHGYFAGESIGLKRIRPEVLATMPSGYQLFPHPIANWLIDPSGNALPDELFDPATWRRYDGTSTTRRSRREFVPSTVSTPTRISLRCGGTSNLGWSARADSRGCCPRPSPPRRSATCCSVATAR